MSVTDGIDERVVADVWERQAYPPEALERLGFRLLFRGLPSDAGGPDYQEAILVRGGREVLRGDVEFHVRSSDWFGHRHHLDPRYEDVVLHVVWYDDAIATVTLSGRPVPTLALGATVLRPPARRQAPLLTHPCVGEFKRLSTEELRRAVEDAGIRRFAQRAERYAADITVVSPDQALYTALFESLGYASNRQAFRELAEAVPFEWLVTVPSTAWPQTLLDAAGLGPQSPISPPARLHPGVWRLIRLRPANHPAIRLVGICSLLERLSPDLADAVTNLVDEAARPSSIRSALLSRKGDDGLIGTGRADEMAVSVVLPFVAALQPDVIRAEILYRSYPAPPSTRWTRLMQGLLAEAGHPFPVRRAIHHQGLHALYLAHCRGERRASCPVCGQHA